jgi:cysteine desulfurase
MNEWAYLDNNATTAVAPEVRDAMLPFLGELYGNPSSMHSFGGVVGRDVEKARKQVASLIGADPSEILFTSCGTEEDNLAILGSLWAQPLKKKIITTRVEHPAVRTLCRRLDKQGYEVHELHVDREGLLDLDELREALTDDTAIVSVMHANNETGVVFPIREISAICRERGVRFHTDAVQSVGKIEIDVSSLGVDLLTLSGHKIHAPKGVGALYVRRGLHLQPLIVGGHQEHGRRGGTENVPSIVALGRACELAKANIEEENVRVRALRDRLEKGLIERAPNAMINGSVVHRLPNTASISFEYVEGEAILLLLSQAKVAASSGSACTSGSLEPSHVLRAMGVPYTAAHGSIRFSFSVYNDDDDVDRVLEVLPPIIERLRKLSPFGPGRDNSWAEEGGACISRHHHDPH